MGGLFSRCCGRGSQSQTVSQPLLNTTAPTPAVQDASGAVYVPPSKAEMTATVTVPCAPKAVNTQVTAPAVPALVDSSPAAGAGHHEAAADAKQVLIDLEDSQSAQPVSPAAAAPAITSAIQIREPAVVHQEAAVEPAAESGAILPAQPSKPEAAPSVQHAAAGKSELTVDPAIAVGAAVASMDSNATEEAPGATAAAAPEAPPSAPAPGSGGRGGSNSQSGGRGGGRKNHRGGGGNKGGGGRGGGKRGKGRR